MSTLKDAGKGWQKEVVTEYSTRLNGVVVPSAFEDGHGGRPDLNGKSYLDPPIDDPPMDGIEDLPPNRLRMQTSDSDASSGAKKVSKSVPVNQISSTDYSGILNEIRRIVNEQCTTKEDKQKTLNITKKSDESDNHIDINTLATLLSDPSILKRISEQKSLSSAQSQDFGFTEVVMTGSFGRFRSRASKVVICASHITLLYTSGAGDDTLAYEPPLEVSFKLQVPCEDTAVREFNVCHFGLITRIDGIGELVVLPLAAESGSPA